MDAENIPFPPETYMRLVCGEVPDLLEKFTWAGKLLVKMLAEEGLISADSRLLDVGCGCGRVARYLLDKPLKSYTGFDRHAGMIEWCIREIAPRDGRFKFGCFNIKSIYTDVDQHEGDIDAASFRFPYDDHAFDTVLLASIFTHMPMAESVNYLKQLQRVVRPKGKVMLSVFYSQDKPYSEGIGFYYDREAFLEAVKKSGFEYRFREELYGHHWYILTRK